MNFGGQGILGMSPEFYFSNWENFGEEDNDSFLYCLKKAENKKVVLDVIRHVSLFSMLLSKRIVPEGNVKVSPLSPSVRLVPD